MIYTESNYPPKILEALHEYPRNPSLQTRLAFHLHSLFTTLPIPLTSAIPIRLPLLPLRAHHRLPIAILSRARRMHHLHSPRPSYHEIKSLRSCLAAVEDSRTTPRTP